MGLSLKELVELAMLDGVMDKPVPLGSLMAAGAQWHELAGRNDINGMMTSLLQRLLHDGQLAVHEADGPLLVGSEAAMAFDRANSQPELLQVIEASVTDEGKQRYKQLAHRYYNG